MTDEMRPINLRIDLADLADLMELVFADTMDSSGRAALREIRYLSHMGPGLALLSHVNDIAFGLHLGYVWVSGGELVGNVSVYSARWPADLGSVWVIANVGVHPDFRRKGIARKLMQASMRLIAQRGGTAAILQVDRDNSPALDLYRSLGFVEERDWTTWRRHSSARLPPIISRPDVLIRRRRWGEWRDEFELAQQIREAERGGLGWMRPLHVSQFRRSLWRTLGDWVNLRGLERLVARSKISDRLLAALWVETGFVGASRLTLLVDPLVQGICDDALLNPVVSRFTRNSFLIEHPDDETATANVLRRYHFTAQRTTTHMRWDAR